MTADELARFLDRNGYIAGAALLDGRLVFITRTITGQGQLGVGDEQSVNDRYTYLDPEHAVIALLDWHAAGFAGEPEGWHRHQPSNRRRVGGNPVLETVAP